VTIAAVLLAAGGGSRFSGDSHKLLADLRGRPVVAWALDNVVAAGLDQTYVVSGAADLSALIPPEATCLDNPDWSAGIATSLAVAVEAARSAGHGAVVVGLGDQPFVPPAAWRAVAGAAGPVVVATYVGRRGNPVKLDASVWPLLPRSGDEGARIVMRQRPDLVEEVACDGDPFDVDTVEDLIRWS
jgi:CTP:molybdopterin cytidylyltransferase MocA